MATKKAPKKTRPELATGLNVRYWMSRGTTFGPVNVPWWWLPIPVIYLITAIWYHWNHGTSSTVFLFHIVWWWTMTMLFFAEPMNKQRFQEWIGLRPLQIGVRKGPAKVRLLFYLIIGIELALFTSIPMSLFTSAFNKHELQFGADLIVHLFLCIPLTFMYMERRPATKYSRMYILIALIGANLLFLLIAVWIEKYPTFIF